MIKHGSKTVDTIFIHCAATRPDWLEGRPLAEKVAEITRWHAQRGFRTIGYHYIIDRDGSLAKGRSDHEVGAHVANHNTGSIGVCLIGGFGSNENDEFLTHFTLAQETALRSLIDRLKTRTPIKRIRGHNEVAAKACPGFQVSRWLNGQGPRTNILQSKTFRAGLMNGGGGLGLSILATFANLDWRIQLVLVGLATVSIITAGIVLKERIRKWVGGHH